jgi:hypothetical protein
MRIREKHFEQVPIEVVETILRQAAAMGRKQERSPALVSLLERQAPAEFLKQEGGAPSKSHP